MYFLRVSAKNTSMTVELIKQKQFMTSGDFEVQS